MTRYFFDFKGPDRRLLDHKGEEFRTVEDARQYAEMITLDLKHRLNGEWVGWSVEIHNAIGQKFLSLPIPAAELIAA
jgi:hypothetical protein